MPDLLSKKQLQTINSIPTATLDIHYGPYGCGKTYAIALGLGYACMRSKPPDSDACIAIIGKTSITVKNSFGGTLSKLFGNNFVYTSSKKDGYVKDALLFGHKIRFLGVNENNAEARIRGINTYKIIGEEVTTWSKDNFELIQGRLRGSQTDIPKGWVRGFIGSTNPDSPAHWLAKILQDVKKGIEKDFRFIAWTENDNIRPEAKKEYARLRSLFRNSPAYLARYVLGQWSAADNLIYTEFNSVNHVLPAQKVKFLMDQGAFASFRFGIDYGTTNPTVILVIGVTKDEEYIILDECVLKGKTTSQIFPYVRKFYATYANRLRGIYIDPSATALKTELTQGGIDRVYGANNDVQHGIDIVKNLFATDRLFVSDACKYTIDEFLTYSYKNPDTAQVKKENDHAMDALRYALVGVRTK